MKLICIFFQNNLHISKICCTFAADLEIVLITTIKKLTIMKEFYVTFFSDICGIIDADVKMYAKSLKALKSKIRDHANKLGANNIDLIQVYNCTDDKLHKAHLKTLNFKAI